MGIIISYFLGIQFKKLVIFTLKDWVSPPAIATANAKRNHFPHHFVVVDPFGGPVGRAGRVPRSFKDSLSLDFCCIVKIDQKSWDKATKNGCIVTLYGGYRNLRMASILEKVNINKKGFQLAWALIRERVSHQRLKTNHPGESKVVRKCVNKSKLYWPVCMPSVARLS